jgi:diguanylate cyclase (GGDEF)-like protein
MRALYGWRFLYTIALPIALAMLAVTSLTHDMVGRISTGAIVEDRLRTREIVVSAFAAVQRQIADRVVQDAKNEYTQEQAYQNISPGWLQTGWGANSLERPFFDMVMVTDQTGVPVFDSFSQPVAGHKVDKLIERSQIEKLLKQLPDDGVSAGEASTLINLAGQPAVLAAAVVVPLPGQNIAVSKLRYLVSLKVLSPEFVSAVGQQYVVRDLAVGDSKLASGDVAVLMGMEQKPVASLTWRDRPPSEFISTDAAFRSNAVLAFLMLVMGGVTVVCWKLIRHVMEREERATYDALHDSLTGLPNRAALFAQIQLSKQSSNRKIAIAFADLDGFKDVNDNHGHDIGDRLIRAVAAGLSMLANDAKLISRLGGDEFVVLFEGDQAEQKAHIFAQHFVNFLAKPFDLDGRVASVGASIGIAASDLVTADPHELMRCADIAMYHAKATGKNRAVSFEPAFDHERLELVEIASELREILAAGTLEIAYQPVFNVRQNRISGVEALARWPASSARSVTPDKFIHVAEQHGLIDELGAFVLRRACNEAKAWPGIRLAVNISPMQLNNHGFAARTLAIIAAAGMAHTRMELEVTESVLIHDAARAQAVFAVLQKAGIQVALDDFGAGFSSVGYLRQFTFDRIKIDRSIVSRVLMGPSEQALVQGTMLLASGLTAEVTAEGVEHAEQVEILRLTGCHEMQGYYFHKAMAAHEFTKLIGESQLIPALVHVS